MQGGGTASAVVGVGGATPNRAPASPEVQRSSSRKVAVSLYAARVLVAHRLVAFARPYALLPGARAPVLLEMRCVASAHLGACSGWSPSEYPFRRSKTAPAAPKRRVP